MPRRAIPDRIDPPIARLELPVHDNAGSVVANARGVELEPVNRRPPPCSNQQMAAGDRLFGAGGFDRCRYGVASLFNAYDIYTAANNDTLAFEAIKKDGHAFRVVIAERSRSLKHGDRTSQTAEGLRQFEADRPGSNNDEMLRPLLEIENALVGKIGAAVEPGNWRHCRRRSGRDHEASRTDLDIACHDRVTILEFRMVVDDPDAKPRKAFDGTQPVLRQSPPILSRSINTVGTPKAAAAAATDNPPGPPPITQMSGASVSAMPLQALPTTI